jgi:thiol:disulfide interchange protein DsbD
MEIQLVSGVEQVKPGQDFYLALHLHHGPGYHSYWKHPGIVGVATQIEWLSLPEGVRVDAISWPQPEQVKMYQTNAQGYKRDVLLPMRVHVPEGLQPGQKLEFKGRAVWMSCNLECNPGLEVLHIQLPVSADTTTASSWAQSIQNELKLQPQTSKHWHTSCTVEQRQVELTVLPVDPAARHLRADELADLRFFTLDGIIDSSQPQIFSLSPEGHLKVRLRMVDEVPGDNAKRLQGLILRQATWELAQSYQALEFHVHLKNSD